MNARKSISKPSRCLTWSSAAKLFLGALAAAAVASPAWAVDYAEKAIESQLKSGLDKASFSEAFKSMTADNYRIADIETYRSGRSTSVTTVWTKLAENERWAIEMSMPVGDFIKADKEYREKGFSLVEFEIDRVGGATLHFSGVWLLTEKGLDTEFYFGMETLDFSNRYGEMADRGYRLIDFEAYESNGKYRQAAIWLKNEEQLQVRFYRGIQRKQFAEMITTMREAKFRVLDVEGYQVENDFVFAVEWVKMSDNQESDFAYDLLPDEFYSKNATMTSAGFRLTEFEVYEERDTLYYAGSWLKVNKVSPADAAAAEAESKKKRKTSSLEAFRSGE